MSARELSYPLRPDNKATPGGIGWLCFCKTITEPTVEPGSFDSDFVQWYSVCRLQDMNIGNGQSTYGIGMRKGVFGTAWISATGGGISHDRGSGNPSLALD